MSVCVVCSKPKETTIPAGAVCREHAIEFYTTLVTEGAKPERKAESTWPSMGVVQEEAVYIPPPLVWNQQGALVEDLYAALVGGTMTFWADVSPMLRARDITRENMRDLITRGLRQVQGHYPRLLQLWHMPVSDHKRFLNFIATHECRGDYRKYRKSYAAKEATNRDTASLTEELECVI
jgi:hypothetical protein